MIKKKIKIYFILYTITIYLYSCMWGAGSYAYAEPYLINLNSAEELIDSIKAIKQKDNTLNINYVNEDGDTVSEDVISYGFYMSHFKIDSVGYMCAINTYQKKEKMVTILLVSIAIGDGIDKNEWKGINTDELSKEENKRFKKLFEEKVLSRLEFSNSQDQGD